MVVMWCLPWSMHDHLVTAQPSPWFNWIEWRGLVVDDHVSGFCCHHQSSPYFRPGWMAGWPKCVIHQPTNSTNLNRSHSTMIEPSTVIEPNDQHLLINQVWWSEPNRGESHDSSMFFTIRLTGSSIEMGLRFGLGGGRAKCVTLSLDLSARHMEPPRL